MKKMLVAFFCLLLALPLSSVSESVPRQRAEALESSLSASGFEMRTDVSFEWGGLPMLTDQENGVLESLLEATAFRTRRKTGERDGYAAFDLLLQNVSVLDLAMQSIEGRYFETSNLLGGQTVAFTKEEFSSFARRVAERSEGALLSNLDILYDLTMLGIGGPDAQTVDMDTLSGFLRTIDEWKALTLMPTELRRPKTTLPGVYGARADAYTVSREDALRLAKAVGTMLTDSENISLWQNTLRAQYPDEPEAQARERIQSIADLIRTLEDSLAAALPENMPPAEYREVYGLDNTLVCRQLWLELPGRLLLDLEWDIGEEGPLALYAAITGSEMGATLLYTHSEGMPRQDGSVFRQQNRDLAEFSFFTDDIQLDLMVTNLDQIELRADREILTGNTEYILHSDALLGEDIVVTLSFERSGKASGEGTDYQRTQDTTLYVKGLGFDAQKVLTVSKKIVPLVAAPPISLETEAALPALFTDEALDAWLKALEVSFLQAGYTILGRLPPSVAMYVLENWM